MAIKSVSTAYRRLLLTSLFIFSFTLFWNHTSAQDIQITDPTLNTPQEYTVSSITVEGNEYTREQFIITAGGIRQGDLITYPGEDISNALKRLYSVGLFSDVQILITNRTTTSLGILIRVTEQPRLLEYKIEGVKRSERRELKKEITFTPGAAITDANVEQAKRTILRYFREKGLWFTEIETSTELTDEAENRSVLTFHVKKGQKLEVKDVVFEGNEAYSDKQLTRRMKPLKEDAWYKFLSKKVYKEEDFLEGREKVLTHYRDNGYMDVRIVSDTVFVYQYKGDKDGVKVRLNVEEGPQYKVRNITWDGNTLYTDTQLSQSLGFQKGDVFNQTRYSSNTTHNAESSDISSLYQDNGYLFFRFVDSFTKVGEDSLDIHFDLYEDEIATIDQVIFYGNTNTHDNVVRRTLRTIPGNQYSRQDIIRSVRELSTLGYFNPEGILPDVQPNYEDKTANVLYSLDESESTSNFEFSGGYGGRVIGAIISARLNFNNFSLKRAIEGDFTPFPAGDGQTLSLGVQVTGSGYQSYSFGFVEPWLNGKPTSFGFNVSYNLIKNSYYVERNKLFSASVSLGKRLKWPDDYFSTRSVVSYQLYDVIGNYYGLAEGTSNLITFRQVLERNSLDNFISPNSGSKFTISGEIAPPFKGFSEMYKIKTDFQHHVPIVGKLVMTSQVGYGFIGYFTKDQRSGFQRFLLGGTQLQQRQSFLYDNIDLRGYPGGVSQSIAPIVDGAIIPGRLYSKYSLELRYPAIQSDQLQLIPYVFFDAGNAYLNFSTFDPFNVKRAVGFGTRLFLPVLGLVDLSYGYRLDGVGNFVNAGRWEFLFNIGAPF